MSAPVGLKQIEAPGNRVTHLYGRVTLDASGQAVVATTPTSLGIPMRFSVARTGAGLYTITLVDKWVALLAYSVGVTVAAATPIGRSSVFKIDAANINATPPTLALRCEVPATTAVIGTAADLPNSSVLQIMLCLDRGRI